MSAPERYPELIPLRRFLAVVEHRSLVRQFVGDRFGVFVVATDLGPARERSDDIAADCDEIFARRLLIAAPRDGLVTRLRPGVFGILAFDVRTEADAMAISSRLHGCIRTTVDIENHELRLSASIGVALSGPAMRPRRALRAAELAAVRVMLNGGDATFIAPLSLETIQSAHI